MNKNTIKNFLDEGKKYIEKNDVVQASEKLYKAAEEAIKILAKTYANDVYKEMTKKKRWTTELLFQAADKIGKNIRHYWDSAWILHVEGFHEMKLSIDSVKIRMKDIDKLVKLTDARIYKKNIESIKKG